MSAPLPEPYAVHELWGQNVDVYDARQMHAHAAQAVAAERARWPNLAPVIAWLENGCDPQEAAKELRVYQAAIRWSEA